MLVNKHRFYESKYTMEMYIAHHARCCMGGKGEPFECFFRPGDYITDEERHGLCAVDHEFSDIWWDLTHEDELKEMAEMAILAADRVVCDSTRMSIVLDSLKTSDTVRNDLEEAQEIAKIVGESEDVETMTKEHCLPNAWCVAAEKFLTRKYSERGDERKPSKYWIYYYATDAYLQHVL